LSVDCSLYSILLLLFIIHFLFVYSSLSHFIVLILVSFIVVICLLCVLSYLSKSVLTIYSNVLYFDLYLLLTFSSLFSVVYSFYWLYSVDKSSHSCIFSFSVVTLINDSLNDDITILGVFLGIKLFDIILSVFIKCICLYLFAFLFLLSCHWHFDDIINWVTCCILMRVVIFSSVFHSILLFIFCCLHFSDSWLFSVRVFLCLQAVRKEYLPAVWLAGMACRGWSAAWRRLAFTALTCITWPVVFADTWCPSDWQKSVATHHNSCPTERDGYCCWGSFCALVFLLPSTMRRRDQLLLRGRGGPFHCAFLELCKHALLVSLWERMLVLADYLPGLFEELFLCIFVAAWRWRNQKAACCRAGRGAARRRLFSLRTGEDTHARLRATPITQTALPHCGGCAHGKHTRHYAVLRGCTKNAGAARIYSSSCTILGMEDAFLLAHSFLLFSLWTWAEEHCCSPGKSGLFPGLHISAAWEATLLREPAWHTAFSPHMTWKSIYSFMNSPCLGILPSILRHCGTLPSLWTGRPAVAWSELGGEVGGRRPVAGTALGPSMPAGVW